MDEEGVEIASSEALLLTPFISPVRSLHPASAIKKGIHLNKFFKRTYLYWLVKLQIYKNRLFVFQAKPRLIEYL
jgi:hypothetical protein